MSCYFQANDTDIWNPSNSVARLFLEQAGNLSNLMGVESGLGPVIEDECEIDFTAFTKFVDSLVKSYQQSNNSAFRSLIGGFVSVALVLVERGGGVLESITPEHAEMWESVRAANAMGMPTG
ncbi:hypothetical protein FGW37_15695 [Streptomyces rectiverticillatus]|uniref:DUF6086 family protein n=1 Tax=Streptomyces rectiverticillatus TaxID=173860 RepID=UPI0015C34A28|nr:DUF6086 family protein [Streptomyces rectiverticillatus]QLE72837.1 hypothetical protein FGW37_15695 [Streptomyces rectiverticillatus]